MLNKRYARRLEVMLAAAVCIFLILLGRMAYLQLYKGDYYGNQADGNLSLIHISEPTRH